MRRLLLVAGLAGALMLLAGCAAPHSDLHLQAGRSPGQGTVAVLLWVPQAYLRDNVWLQFERRNAQGQPTGTPVSVALAPAAGSGPRPPARPGFEARVAALALDPGRYVLSRWVAVLDASRTAISPSLAWGFELRAGEAVHLGRLELTMQNPQAQEVPFRLAAAPATTADIGFMQSWLPATASMPWRAMPWPAGQATSGAATVSGTTNRTITNNPGVYIR